MRQSSRYLSKLAFLLFAFLSVLLSGCFRSMYYRPGQDMRMEARLFRDPLERSRFPKYRKNKSRRELVLYLLNTYHSDGFYIVQRNEQMTRDFRVRRTGNYGRKGFMVMVHGEGKQAVLNGIGTIVHELNHMYTSKYPRRFFRKSRRRRPRYFRGYGYYIGKERTVVVPFTKRFPAREIRDLFPEVFLRKRMLHFRYNTYIYPSTRYQSTQVDGIYGLLDELNSYYHGCRANLEMLPYYKSEKKINPRAFGRYFMNVNATRCAYHEFKMFILLYMMKARDSYPGIYRAILQNKPFLLAFLRVEQNFRRLLVRFEKIKRGTDSWLRKRGFYLNETETSIYIKPLKFTTGTTYGYGSFNDIAAEYERELAKPKYNAMMTVMRSHLRKRPGGKAVPR